MGHPAAQKEALTRDGHPGLTAGANLWPLPDQEIGTHKPRLRSWIERNSIEQTSIYGALFLKRFVLKTLSRSALRWRFLRWCTALLKTPHRQCGCRFVSKQAAVASVV